MDEILALKYIEFLIGETNRFLDRGGNDDTLNQLLVELQKFQEKSYQSELPEKIIEQIQGLSLNTSQKRIQRGGITILLAFISLGLSGYFYLRQRQRSQREAVAGLRSNLQLLRMEIFGEPDRSTTEF